MPLPSAYTRPKPTRPGSAPVEVAEASSEALKLEVGSKVREIETFQVRLAEYSQALIEQCANGQRCERCVACKCQRDPYWSSDDEEEVAAAFELEEGDRAFESFLHAVHSRPNSRSASQPTSRDRSPTRELHTFPERMVIPLSGRHRTSQTPSVASTSVAHRTRRRTRSEARSTSPPRPHGPRRWLPIARG